MLPSVADVRAQQQRANKKQRRSKVFREIVQDGASDDDVPRQGGGDRARQTERARAARAANRALVAAPQSAPKPKASLAPTEVLRQIAMDNSALAEVQSGTLARFSTSPLAERLDAIANVGASDEQVSALVDEYCRNPEAVMSTICNKAAALGVDRRRAPDKVMNIASALACADHGSYRKLEEAIASGSHTLVLYLEACSYDETPMETRVEDAVYDIRAKRAAEGIADNPGTLVPRSDGVVTRVLLGEDTGPTKLFQTDTSVALLLRVNGEDPEDNEYVIFLCNPISWVQLLESSSAEAIKTALERCSSVSAASGKFAMRVRAAMCDRLSANLKAEWQLVRDRGPSSFPWPAFATSIERLGPKAKPLL